MDGMGVKFTPGIYRETSINAIQTCLGLWLVLLGPIASPNSQKQSKTVKRYPNSPNGGFGQSYSSYSSYYVL